MDTLVPEREDEGEVIVIDNATLTQGISSTTTIHGHECAMSSVLGPRESNEDAHQLCDLNMYLPSSYEGKYSFLGIFDGHGGDEASRFAAASLPKMLAKNKNLEVNPTKALELAFQYTDRSFAREHYHNSFAGSTAIVSLLVTNEEGTKLYVANAGDCRGILVRKGSIERLTTDHSPLNPAEYKRITDAGGSIITETFTHPSRGNVSVGRVAGVLSVARGIGDLSLKPYISSKPDVTVVDVNDDTDFVIMACDGLWDVFGDEEVGKEFKARLAEGKTMEDALKSLCEEAVCDRDSTDNVTAVALRLH
ncbi:Serine/threonine phosphatase, family [Carpediemonas membranifera]|uniref:Serine/threonine phosphatase, family n=1 Tax=Carpediemonas membranifera TaxID=201153 RepID=A0A8J6ATZ1_9EUKA|nr:Serine/threonine phosphatase, family [Carpediemonas membranifera]|eukprot:KAG9394078.1 Serine/threonine phosphatase, family [Carpediemonas membranifera]